MNPPARSTFDSPAMTIAPSKATATRRSVLGFGATSTLSFLAMGGAAGEAQAKNSGGAALDPERLLGLSDRQQAALRIREEAAVRQSKIRVEAPQVNADEALFPQALGSYTKGLPHDDMGVVDPAAWTAFVKAMNTGLKADLDMIPMGGTVKQANPQAAFAFEMSGPDSHALRMPAPPSFSSAETAGEMVELYAHALLRDVPFESYATAHGVAPVLDSLNRLTEFKAPRSGQAITAGTLFRGMTPGELNGHYLSQFLLLPIPCGAQTITQTYRVTAQGDDHVTTAAEWLRNQRGLAPARSNTFDLVPRYLTTGRDLGEYVHRDYPCQAFHNAGLILMGLKASVNPGNPYLASANQGGFVTFGLADMLSRVSEISRIALKAAWFQKWRLYRRLRPEAYAGRVDQMLNNQASYPLHRDVLQSPILQAIHNQTGSHLLPLAYPEGAPTHPAYPSGHATIAGACVTVLKAFFDPNFVLRAPVVVDPASNGTALKTLAATLTVEGELNKLAGNLAIGRNLAGVHWRSDAQEGLMLGQAVALSVLQDWKLTYNENPGPISFRGFNGELITV